MTPYNRSCGRSLLGERRAKGLLGVRTRRKKISREEDRQTGDRQNENERDIGERAKWDLKYWEPFYVQHLG